MSDLVSLIGRLAEAIFVRLPSVVIAWKYPPRAIAKRFFIELGSTRAVQVTLQDRDARVTLYLRAVNLSPLWIETEHLDFEVSVGHQLLYKGQVIKKKRIDAFTAFPEFGYGHRSWGTDHLYFDLPVDSGRAKAIKDSIPQWHGPFDVQVRIQVHGLCKTGRIERLDVSFDLPSGAAGVTP